MTDYDTFGGTAVSSPLSPVEKAAAVLLAMGKGVAGKLLKYFSQSELQSIIAAAQSLRAIPPHELVALVNEFEDLFTEGTGLMDNARAMEGILEEGLTPEEVDGLLGRRAPFQTYPATVWEQLQETDPVAVSRFLLREHPQTVAYVLSRMPSTFGAKVLMEIPDERRTDIIARTVNLKETSPRATAIVEARVIEMIEALNAERDSAGSSKVADLMNELEKGEVDRILSTLSTDSARKLRPKIFLFDDILQMPQRSRVTLFNDITGDTITAALRGASMELREAVLSAIGARQRRMIESDLAAGDQDVNPRDIAVARRAITQEAIRLATAGQIQLKEQQSQAA